MALLTVKRLLTGFLLLLLFLSAAVQAAEIGTVTQIEGQAEVIRVQGSLSLSLGSIIEDGDVLLTKKDSLLKVSFTDGSGITLGESTRLSIAEYHADSKPAGFLELARGRLRSVVSKVFSEHSESFRVRTPTAVAGVQGTDFVVVVEPKRTRVVVCEGVVSVRSASPDIPGQTILHPGEEITVDEDQPPGPPLAQLGLNPAPSSPIFSGGALDLASGGNQFTNPGSMTPSSSTSAMGPNLPPIPNLP